MKISSKFCILAAFLLLFSGCKKEEDSPDTPSPPAGTNYKQKMRDFVQNLSAYAASINPNFVIIPQNGAELVSSTGDEDGQPAMDYLNSIDAMGQEDLFYGYNEDNQETPPAENEWITTFLDMGKSSGNLQIMVTDYCSSPAKIDDSYAVNNAKGYLSFAANHRELNNIPNYPPTPYNENPGTVTTLSEVQNFLYLISPDDEYATQQAFVDAVSSTNYDCVIMDFFFDGAAYTPSQISQLKQKANGGERLLICYLSIGEAEDYRYYWQPSWSVGNPSFIVEENSDWPGNYVVQYWQPEWQSIIYGNENAYLKKILDAGFNGAYLDIIDGFENFE